MIMRELHNGIKIIQMTRPAMKLAEARAHGTAQLDKRISKQKHRRRGDSRGQRLCRGHREEALEKARGERGWGEGELRDWRGVWDSMDAQAAATKMLDAVEDKLTNCHLTRKPMAALNMAYADGIVEAGRFSRCNETGLEYWTVSAAGNKTPKTQPTGKLKVEKIERKQTRKQSKRAMRKEDKTPKSTTFTLTKPKLMVKNAAKANTIVALAACQEVRQNDMTQQHVSKSAKKRNRASVNAAVNSMSVYFSSGCHLSGQLALV